MQAGDRLRTHQRAATAVAPPRHPGLPLSLLQPPLDSQGASRAATSSSSLHHPPLHHSGVSKLRSRPIKALAAIETPHAAIMMARAPGNAAGCRPHLSSSLPAALLARPLKSLAPLAAAPCSGPGCCMPGRCIGHRHPGCAAASPAAWHAARCHAGTRATASCATPAPAGRARARTTPPAGGGLCQHWPSGWMDKDQADTQHLQPAAPAAAQQQHRRPSPLAPPLLHP